jgi:hypothetical protein
MVLGIVELVQAFCRTGGGQSRNSLVKTNLQTTPTPCKKKQTNQPNSSTTSLVKVQSQNAATIVVMERVVKGGGNVCGKRENGKWGAVKGNGLAGDGVVWWLWMSGMVICGGGGGS